MSKTKNFTKSWKIKLLGLLYFLSLLIFMSIVSAANMTINQLLDTYSYEYNSGDLRISSYSDLMIDADSDNENDTLILSLTFNTTNAGTYTIIANLIDKDGLISNETDKTLSSGITDLNISFSSKLLSQIMYNYTVRVYNASDSLVYRKDKMLTNNHTHYEKGISIISISDQSINSDYLQINLTLNVTDSQTVNITGYLKYNESYISAKDEFSLSEGLQTVELKFNNETIKRTHYNGNYTLDYVAIGTKIFDTNYTTSSYNYEDFAETSYLKSYDVTIIDTNANNLSEYLRLNTTLEIKTSGTYLVDVKLYDLYGEFIANASSSQSLSTGPQNIIININGTSIYKSKLNGPYSLEYAKLSKQGETIDIAYQPYITNIYYYDDFERPPLADLIPSISIIDNSTANITVINIGKVPAFNIIVDIFDDDNLSITEPISYLNVSKSQTIPINLSANYSVLTAITDFGNLVDESNESNNIVQNVEELKQNGESCTQNSECNSNNCRKEIDSTNYYCAATNKECSEGVADHQGYDSDELGNQGNADWLCTASDTSVQCGSPTNQCDEYGSYYCNGAGTWTAGDSYHLDAACGTCTWCGGTAGTDGDISCVNQASGDAFDDCAESCSGYTHIDGDCDGSGACNTGVVCANYLDCADATSCNTACTDQSNCRSNSYYCNAAGNGCNSDVTDCNTPTDYYSGTVNEACVGGYGRQDWDSTYFCTDDSTGCVTDNTGSCNERANGYEACDGDNDRVCRSGTWSNQIACPDQTCSGAANADSYLTDSTCVESTGCSTQTSTECSTCQTCSGTSCVNYGDNTQDSVGSNTCDSTCAACQSGSCGIATEDTDPGDDCGLVECDDGASPSYYYGWDSLTCYYREDEANSDCDGSGACKLASDYCPSNPQDGSSGVSCDCEAAEIACSGTTIGSCDNELCGPSPTIGINLVYPTEATNVTQNQFFNFTTEVCCNDADCGEINVSLDPETTEYTPSTETQCKDGTCNTVLYSGIRFVYEGNKWKKVEEARSLKGIWKVIKNEDPNYPVEVIDFNYTSIILDLSVSEDKLNKDIDFEVYNKYNKSEKLTDKKIKLSKQGVRTIIDFSKTSKNILGQEIKWGDDSTTIQLQDADSENLEDTYVNNNSPISSYGYVTQISTAYTVSNSSGVYRAYIMFNLSSIPNEVDITEAAFAADFHIWDGSGGAGTRIVGIYFVNNTDWDENTMTWNNQPCGTVVGSLNGSCSSQIDNESLPYSDWRFYTWNVTSSVQDSYNDGKDKISFTLTQDLENSIADYSRRGFYSKEYTTDISKRPYLNITYSEGEAEKGLISTTTGATPFYTNGTNPTSINLNQDECEEVTWWVNATGSIDSSYEFFAYANKTSDMSISNRTNDINITIISGQECSTNEDCGTCEKCVDSSCVYQTGSEDLKNECSETDCYTGNCDGAGSCDIYTSNEEGQCAVCYECNDADSACDLIADHNQDTVGSNTCTDTCKECDGAGNCANQDDGYDYFNDCSESCSDYIYTPGTCDGSGSCTSGSACANNLTCLDATSCKTSCTSQSDCRNASYYCNAAGDACPADASLGGNCVGVAYSGTNDEVCDNTTSAVCDDDGVGTADDNWCFVPYNTYFDGQETDYCEYSASAQSTYTDEKTVGTLLNRCDGTSYYEEKVASDCTTEDHTSVFECGDTGCSCIDTECDGIAPQGTIDYCDKGGETYFQDDCGSSATAEDHDNICRSANSLQAGDGCTADAECNGVTAGTGDCNASCNYIPDTTPPFINILSPVNNTEYSTTSVDLNWTSNKTLTKAVYSLDGGSNTSLNKLCYQESANISTDCGGLSTGNYSCSGDWNPSYPCSRAYDGNWSTGTTIILESGVEGYIYVNYTKPIGALNSSLWLSKGDAIFGTQNLSIPINCWNQNPLQFLVSYIGFTPTAYRKCWDGTSWLIIDSTAPDFTFYEEVMWWNLTLFNTTLTSLSEGLHNITIYGKDTSGNMGQSDYVYFMVETTPSVNLTITSLQTIYSDDTYYIFEFIILNNGSTNLTNINWSLDTGLDIINSQNPLNLTANENTTIFVDYTYSQTGTYSVIATATDGVSEDSETTTVNIVDLEVLDLSVLNSSGMSRTFEFIIKNYLNTELNNVSWNFDFGDGNDLNSTNIILQPLENMSVYVDYTYSSPDTYVVNASAMNGTLEGYNNITIIVT